LRSPRTPVRLYGEWWHPLHARAPALAYAAAMALHKRFDVLALVGCDGDYVPLMRKLNGIGTRTMVLPWDFQYEYQGKQRVTRTDETLIEASTYPAIMATRIDSRETKKDEERYVRGLFAERY